jgi:hypothetical protein
MKRDMDLSRQILLEIEKSPSVTGYIEIILPGKTNDEISYTIKLLSEANLIEAKNLTDSTGFDWKAISLTWQGHDFLDSARDNTRWEKAKSIAIKKAGTLTFEVLKQILASLIKGEIS